MALPSPNNHSKPAVNPEAIWGSASAGMSLTTAAAAWLLSGLTPAPLINSLFTVVDTLPNFLSIPTSALGSLWLQIAALGLLLLVSLGVAQLPVVVLIAIFLFSLGRRLGRWGFLDRFLTQHVLPMQRLQLVTETGQVLGNLLAGLLFPLGQAVLQFCNALLLLLPLFSEARQAKAQPPETLPLGQMIPLRGQGLPVLQGMLIGALFALLPLWVRAIAQGNCFGFGMLLAAYSTGRIVGNTLPSISPLLANLAIAALLSPLPGLANAPLIVLLFFMLGGVVALADQSIQGQLMNASSDLNGWIAFERLSSIGALMGSLGLGLFAQITDLTQVHPVIVLGFIGTALLHWTRG
jgi:hypothetical protein